MHINDVVIALSDNVKEGSQKRKKGEKHIITGLKTCPNCKTLLFNINNEKTKVISSKCKCGQHFLTDNKCWTSYEHFVSIDDLKNEVKKEKIIRNYLELEEYEKLAVIRDYK
jgi:hypothetical protein